MQAANTNAASPGLKLHYFHHGLQLMMEIGDHQVVLNTRPFNLIARDNRSIFSQERSLHGDDARRAHGFRRREGSELVRPTSLPTGLRARVWRGAPSLLPCLFRYFQTYRPIIALIHANHQRTRPKKAAAAPAGSVPTFSAQRHALGMEAGASDVKCQREGDTNAASSRKKPHPSSRRR